MPTDEQTGALGQDTRALLNTVAVYRMSIANRCEELTGSQLDEVVALLKPSGMMTRMLRELTSHELNWLAHIHEPSSSGGVRRSELPPHDTVTGTGVLAEWQVASRRSREAAQHLTELCNQGVLDEKKLRMELIPLMAAYACCDAKLEIVRCHGN
ncbi:hypothetical protein ACIBCO_38690 [Streptomyces violascens]|uniref:hypothetical protein n=1 Tax=Streptomyces violascens TaxID=67381 RepID=UPI003792DF12